MIDLIERKKTGKALLPHDIHEWIRGIVAGEIPDYQSAALLMAIRFRGLTEEETFALTVEMIRSGETIDLSSIRSTTADKHSTGGVGDKLSFLIGPMVAACGVPVPMLSGRALGHTGGTLDKLESIPGYQTSLPIERFVEIVKKVGISIVGQTKSLAPADGHLYALRDVTATVDSIPLIVASILSKKIAAGPEAVVFDVKCGDGAILQDGEDTRRLASSLVKVARRLGRKASALITDMSTPLGRTVGNALEIEESILFLRGEADAPDMEEISFALAAEMLLLAGRAESDTEARELLMESLHSGRAAATFQEMIFAHRGDPRVVEDPNILPKARHHKEVKAATGGFVTELPARAVGLAAMRLGAGRGSMEETIHPGAGIKLLRKPGEAVDQGDVLAVLHSDDKEKLKRVEAGFADLFRIEAEAPPARPRILESLRGGGEAGE